VKRHYIIGSLAGWAVWIVLVAIDFAYAASISSIPKAVRGVTDAIVTAIGLAAWPLALGGWFIWGEGAHMSPALNVAIGLALYGTLGVIAATFVRHR
jgi:hypothetical protein